MTTISPQSSIRLNRYCRDDKNGNSHKLSNPSENRENKRMNPIVIRVILREL